MTGAYAWEWVSDLAVIPAGECFLAGVLAGMALTLMIVYLSEGDRK